MGTHSQNLVPGSDNTYDLGTSSARWKDLFLRHGAKLYDASSDIWELDYWGITRSKYEGRADLSPRDAPAPDYVSISLPVSLDDADYVVELTGAYQRVADGHEPATNYDIYASWHLSNVTTSGFDAYVSFTVYQAGSNTPRAHGTIGKL